jgi:hypothetical protein
MDAVTSVGRMAHEIQALYELCTFGIASRFQARGGVVCYIPLILGVAY